MSEHKLDEEDKKNKLLTEICQRLESEAKNKLGQKISKFQVTAYNTFSSIDLIGEVIFYASIGFWAKLWQRFKTFTVGFDYRTDSMRARKFTEAEKIFIEKFIFNFSCLNSLKYKQCHGVKIRTDLVNPNALTYRFEMLSDLFPVNDKL